MCSYGGRLLWGGGNEMKLKKPLIGSVILYVSERGTGHMTAFNSNGRRMMDRWRQKRVEASIKRPKVARLRRQRQSNTMLKIQFD